MPNQITIVFNPSDSSFAPAKKWKERDWFDTSFARSEQAIGRLRLPAVDNGRYNSKHPVLDSNGNTVGYLSGALDSIGYTWNCVYAANCFWLTNMTFSDTMAGGGRSNVTIVDEVGTFLFSSTKKYKAVKEFDFKGHWAGSTRAFKLLEDEGELFYLTNRGFCLFNTYQRSIISQVDFSVYLGRDSFDFTISPKVKILAVAGCLTGDKDPIDGEYRYDNFIWLYNLETGNLMGEKKLDIASWVRWSIHFSESGREIRVSSDNLVFQFELQAA